MLHIYYGEPDTPEHIFNASACGDNCASWILKIAQKKDLTIRLGYLMYFGFLT